MISREKLHERIVDIHVRCRIVEFSKDARSIFQKNLSSFENGRRTRTTSANLFDMDRSDGRSKTEEIGFEPRIGSNSDEKDSENGSRSIGRTATESGFYDQEEQKSLRQTMGLPDFEPRRSASTQRTAQIDLRRPSLRESPSHDKEKIKGRRLVELLRLI